MLLSTPQKLLVLFLIVSATCAGQAPASTRERAIAFSIDIDAPLDSVWARWTTASGRAKFFAPSSKLELSTLGFMEILFSPDAPEGQRGAENNRVLAVQEKKMLSFTWDAPPTFPEIRKQRTVVIIRFYPLAEKKTRVTLHQLGWGTGSDWDTVYGYFQAAWSTFVLPNLKYSLEVKPVDWTNFPNNAPKGLKPAVAID